MVSVQTIVGNYKTIKCKGPPVKKRKTQYFSPIDYFLFNDNYDYYIHANNDYYVRCKSCGSECNGNALGGFGVRTQPLNSIMQALVDPNTHIISGFSSKDSIRVISTLLEGVSRRVKRDNVFDVILKATAKNKPKIEKIQDEIAGCLNLKLNQKSVAERATLLHDRIKKKKRILVILSDLFSGIDLGKVGIPFGKDHTDCKQLLTSTREEVLFDQMQTQKNFTV